ncbi:MAG: hypothetical protein COA47_09320 [Robiginitomaculum sp.]|nr:MAG: hypothetical protein COA47_09320 [Robiginitomaculum sp.]
MNRWLVKATRDDGEVEELIVMATNELAAAGQARSRGLNPIKVSLDRAKTAKRIRGSGPAATRIARELSALIGAGLTVEKALASIQKFADGSLTAKVATELLIQVRAGQSLSQAIAAQPVIFPPPFAQIAEAGEASGSLADTLADLADWREKREKFESEMRGALLYPILLLIFSTLAVTGLMLFVVPQFEQIFTDMNVAPPPFAGMVFASSHALVLGAPLIGFGLAGFGLLFATWLRQPQSGRTLYRIAHGLPAIGPMVRAMLAARFCRVLAVLLHNGLSTAPAFRLASAGLQDQYAKERLQSALIEVRRGASLPDQIEQADVLPPMAVEILRIGEETGDIAPAAKRLAVLYEGQLERGTKLGVRIIEPILIGFVGLVIGTIVLSILLALVSINEIGF